MKILKQKNLKDVRASLFGAKEKAKQADAMAKPAVDTRRTYLTVPYYTPSDDVDIENITEEQKKKLVAKGKLMAGGHPITITNIVTRKEGFGSWLSPDDFTFDAGTSYKAWTYTWAYLALTIATFVWIHPLLAVPLAWKTGHNWGQYIGGLVFGKEDMKGKIMYRTT